MPYEKGVPGWMTQPLMTLGPEQIAHDTKHGRWLRIDRASHQAQSTEEGQATDHAYMPRQQMQHPAEAV
jgi:hypothetical protein